MLPVRYFVLAGQRTSPAVDELEGVPARFRAAIICDIEQIAEYGLRAPVSIKSITGHTPLMELRNGGYRTFFVIDRGEMWILRCCRKQDQRHGIEVASDRMRLVRER